jgi:hypothetical protein
LQSGSLLLLRHQSMPQQHEHAFIVELDVLALLELAIGNFL